MEYVKDYFGNEIRVGDKVLFSKSNSSTLAIGEVIKLGKLGTSVTVKIVFMPYEGYWRSAAGREKEGPTMKVMLKETVEEHERRRAGEEGNEKWVDDYYSTDYVYAVKFTGEIPDKQYRLLRTEEKQWNT